MDSNILFGDEIEALLQVAIVTYTGYAKALPGTAYAGAYDACLHATCRDQRYPTLRCSICDQAVAGQLALPMQRLIQMRRARLATARNSIAGAHTRLARASDIRELFEVFSALHDETVKIAAEAPVTSSGGVEPIRTGNRGGRKKAAA
jgi:hypothetical protein